MIRFYVVIIFNFYMVFYYVIKMKRYIRNKKYDEKFKYNYARKIVHHVSKKGRIHVDTYGIDNIPSNPGYVMYSNHQGKYDALAIIESHENPCTVVIDKKKSYTFMTKQFLDMIKAKRLDKSDARQAIRVFQEIEKEVKEGRNYLIFPEGFYNGNKNSLNEFQTGCIKFVFNAKCPILPICLYDTYKVYGINSLKKVSCEVHFLKPIIYDEYKDLSKKDLSLLIKERIQEKLDELKLEKEEK